MIRFVPRLALLLEKWGKKLKGKLEDVGSLASQTVKWR